MLLKKEVLQYYQSINTCKICYPSHSCFWEGNNLCSNGCHTRVLLCCPRDDTSVSIKISALENTIIDCKNKRRFLKYRVNMSHEGQVNCMVTQITLIPFRSLQACSLIISDNNTQQLIGLYKYILLCIYITGMRRYNGQLYGWLATETHFGIHLCSAGWRALMGRPRRHGKGGVGRERVMSPAYTVGLDSYLFIPTNPDVYLVL